MSEMFWPVRKEHWQKPTWHPLLGWATMPHRGRPIYAPVGGKISLSQVWPRATWPYYAVALPVPELRDEANESFVTRLFPLEIADEVFEGAQILPGQYLGIVPDTLGWRTLHWELLPETFLLPDFAKLGNPSAMLRWMKETIARERNPLAWASESGALFVDSQKAEVLPFRISKATLPEHAPSEAAALEEAHISSKKKLDPLLLAAMGAGAYLLLKDS